MISFGYLCIETLGHYIHKIHSNLSISISRQNKCLFWTGLITITYGLLFSCFVFILIKCKGNISGIILPRACFLIHIYSYFQLLPIKRHLIMKSYYYVSSIYFKIRNRYSMLLQCTFCNSRASKYFTYLLTVFSY